MDMRLFDARMAGIVVDVDVIDIAAGRREIVEAWSGLRSLIGSM